MAKAWHEWVLWYLLICVCAYVVWSRTSSHHYFRTSNTLDVKYCLFLIPLAKMLFLMRDINWPEWLIYFSKLTVINVDHMSKRVWCEFFIWCWYFFFHSSQDPFPPAMYRNCECAQVLQVPPPLRFHHVNEILAWDLAGSHACSCLNSSHCVFATWKHLIIALWIAVSCHNWLLQL